MERITTERKQRKQSKKQSSRREMETGRGREGNQEHRKLRKMQRERERESQGARVQESEINEQTTNKQGNKDSQTTKNEEAKK